jgi:hypothetical protein
MSEPRGYYTIVHGNIIPDAEPQPVPEVCEWKRLWSRFSSDPEYWSTSCDNAWYFIDGTPEENRVKYCPFCGKPIKVTT